MYKKIHHRKSLLVLSSIILGAILFIECTSNQAREKSLKPAAKVQFSEFAGSQACAACHKDIYDTHIHTAHFHTSEPATKNSIKGSFTDGKNRFEFNPDEYIAMEKRNGRLYQVAYFQGQEERAEPFDITTGSGKRGQTYLYWKNNRLFQLPISYFTSLNLWTNSPGFSNRVAFSRPITSRCLECHSTYFQKLSDQEEDEEFSKTNIIYGVDCEKCHGPGARHIAFHSKNPGEKTGRFIINTEKLTRQQNLDLCRLCHGGRLKKTTTSFSFQPGDSLSGFFTWDNTPPSPGDIDVHGNQYGLLAASKCFQGSQMTCLTCHNPHKNEENMMQTYSQRCMNCHNKEHNNFCKLKDQEKHNITSNCIDCHMPELSSRAIMVLLQGETIPTPASMHTHYITIYPEQTKKYLSAKHK
jgi:hypothetical protein